MSNSTNSGMELSMDCWFLWIKFWLSSVLGIYQPRITTPLAKVPSFNASLTRPNWPAGCLPSMQVEDGPTVEPDTFKGIADMEARVAADKGDKTAPQDAQEMEAYSMWWHVKILHIHENNGWWHSSFDHGWEQKKTPCKQTEAPWNILRDWLVHV